jgi:hypothetical protein
MTSASDSRELITIEEFLTLSAKINYQLSARSLKPQVLLSLVLGPAQFDAREQEVLVEAFLALQAGYDQDRRRLGTPGILHPLRAAALLARSLVRPTLPAMLAALFHDKEEDLTEKDVGTERYERMQGHFRAVLGMLSAAEGERVADSIHCLSNLCGDYSEYVGQLADAAARLPELLHVKLCDRIDNTFDVHLQHPGVSRFNFYRAVFDILFLPSFRGVSMGSFHFMPDTSEGTMLLSQLFKNTLLLAMLRNHHLDTRDETTRRLFVGLAVAGIREAQWLALEMFNTVYKDVKRQRALLLDVMEYCANGGIESVRARDAANDLDGVFVTFTCGDKKQQKQMLVDLFQDHDQLARIALAFIVVFAAFINDPCYTLRGLDRKGARPLANAG